MSVEKKLFPRIMIEIEGSLILSIFIGFVIGVISFTIFGLYSMTIYLVQDINHGPEFIRKGYLWSGFIWMWISVLLFPFILLWGIREESD